MAYRARAKNPARPNLVNIKVYMTNLETNLLEGLICEAVQLFLVLLAQICMALIQDFHQWFCKESARRAVLVICNKLYFDTRFNKTKI